MKSMRFRCDCGSKSPRYVRPVSVTQVASGLRIKDWG
jgi:hypothetical protein